MTCIIGYVDKNKDVFIGGDSAGVGVNKLHVRSDKKVFRNNNMIFGFTTSFRMGQIIQYCFTPPKNKYKNDYKYLCNDFIFELQECFKKHGYEKKDRVGEKQGGTFLMGYKGKLYYIGDDFQVGQVYDNILACGCGDQCAIGAMYALKDNSKITSKKKVLTALDIVSKNDSCVCKPFNVVKL